MNQTSTLILFLAFTTIVGCAVASNVGHRLALNPNHSTDQVTTASGVKFDPVKHRVITYQMW